MDLNGGDDNFDVFTCSAVVGAKIVARFFRFDPGQEQRPSALGARRSEIVDKFEIRCIHIGLSNALTDGKASYFRRAKRTKEQD